MKTTNKLAIAALACAISFAANADGIMGSIGYAKRGAIDGFEVQLGYRKIVGDVGFNIIPLSGIWYKNDNSKYREETFGNGSTVCRDKSNGQFADTEKCGPSFGYAAIFAADYSVSEKFKVGLGLRVGKDTDPFATLRYAITEKVSLQVSAGGKYSTFGIAMGY